ncbi:MAG TPA: hypothetical protein VGR16_12440 [Thermomicrobiales bacterium]|nr:hypothetical protein [Thermomicrobiales bacterium]
MGLEARINQDTRGATITARCDNCMAHVTGHAKVFYSDVDDETFLICSPACADTFMRETAEQHSDRSEPITWGNMPITTYWLAIGVQLDIFPPETRESVIDQIRNGELRGVDHAE